MHSRSSPKILYFHFRFYIPKLLLLLLHLLEWGLCRCVSGRVDGGKEIERGNESPYLCLYLYLTIAINF